MKRTKMSARTQAQQDRRARKIARRRGRGVEAVVPPPPFPFPEAWSVEPEPKPRRVVRLGSNPMFLALLALSAMGGEDPR